MRSRDGSEEHIPEHALGRLSGSFGERVISGTAASKKGARQSGNFNSVISYKSSTYIRT